MEGIIFWLIPVALLAVLTIVLVNHGESKKPTLFLVEPLGNVFCRWRIARFVGDKYWLEFWLENLKSAHCSARTPLELVLDHTTDLRPGRRSELLDCRALNVFGEQRLVKVGNRAASVLLGSIDEVLPYVRYGHSGKRLLTEEEIGEARRICQAAGEHGYLPLVMASRSVNGVTMPKGEKSHTYVGIILLEPELEPTSIARLKKLGFGNVRFLSVLPQPLLEWLWLKVSGREGFQGIGKKVDTHPRAQEQQWLESPTIGGASFADRYSAVRFLQHHFSCRVISVIDKDQELPSERQITGNPLPRVE